MSAAARECVQESAKALYTDSSRRETPLPSTDSTPATPWNQQVIAEIRATPTRVTTLAISLVPNGFTRS
jgi:hypothetical protein